MCVPPPVTIVKGAGVISMLQGLQGAPGINDQTDEEKHRSQLFISLHPEKKPKRQNSSVQTGAHMTPQLHKETWSNIAHLLLDVTSCPRHFHNCPSGTGCEEDRYSCEEIENTSCLSIVIERLTRKRENRFFF